ncbi:hypothetical protein TVAG_105700 [Trichomonas vaginalis G3]|uniref:Uncharacterized protein n=1 Tax=Trichomonas vaginalis (strain ATCC PRA-98 / G3) TaxID=412133 RepID=A2FLQ9_TRIV3|nr:hypothetical protein TVAGG3_0515390 [Trichomonas vaginalis G3]EAX94151.1 hypothetical protein TVAG_105700 [Trichomonas vaginalis G3]KAI5518082.1 hypothetical protein TVAGG3_0515390 [Trichomonas vaginalis G3]|eukprot:XP_001307081.1 hypothetical protein [Trichomonas vaginalis G3]
MFFIFSILTISANETLCGNQTLPSGYVCCDDEACPYQCYKLQEYNHGGSKEVCLSHSQETFCRHSEYGLFISAGIAILPNIIFVIISLIFSPHTHCMTIFYSLFANIAWSSFTLGLVCRSFVPPWYLNWILPFAIGLCCIFTIIPVFGCDICGNKAGCIKDREFLKQKQMLQEMTGKKPDAECCGLCGTEACSVTYVLHHISYPKVSSEELRLMHRENMCLPPTPHMYAISFSYFDKPQTYANSTIGIQYGSWQENGERIEIPAKGIVVYDANGEYEYDENMDQKLDSAKVASFQKMFIYEGCFKVAFAETIASGLTTKAVVVEDSSFGQFCTSTAGKVLWWTTFVFGYSFIFDTIWQINSTRISFHSRKHIYADKSGKVEYGERDII